MTPRNLTTSWYIDLPGYEGTLTSFEYLQPLWKGHRVLDMGCGKGSYLAHFSSESIGIEISSPNLKFCHENGLRVFAADLNNPLPLADQSFPVLFCSHVLEHVDAPIRLLRECNRVLETNGILILGLPIEPSLINRFRGDHYFRKHPGHLSSFTIDNIDALLDKTGFARYGLYFELRGSRRRPLRAFQGLVQAWPVSMLFRLMMAYWVVARKQ